MKFIYILCFLIFLILFTIILLSVNYGFKVVLMYNRKDKQTMVRELLDNFKTDYRLYNSLASEDVSIKSNDNFNLRGVYHNIHPNSKKVIIINHGYTANRYVCYQFIDIFLEEKYNILLIDMRSHGESEGTFASYGYHESKDIGCWVEWIKSKVGEDAYIGLHGQSMGAASVMIYGGSNPDNVKFVIEDCGFTTAREAITSQFKEAKIPFWPLYDLIRFKAKMLYKFDLNSVSPKEVITHSSVPTLFIHGLDDKIVPSWMAKELYERKRGTKDRLYLVEGAGHMESCCTDKKKYEAEIKIFLDAIK